MKWIPFIVLFCLVFVLNGVSTAEPEVPSDNDGQRQKQLEETFQKTLSGATLIGKYTQNDQPNDKLPADERYTINKVSRVAGKDKVWQFNVRMQFGELDLELPLQLVVEWAGDTPMITLTDYRIPALGTFSARVFFHGNRYAGTWQHGKVGGHLFGEIAVVEPADEEDGDAERESGGDTE